MLDAVGNESVHVTDKLNYVTTGKEDSIYEQEYRSTLVNLLIGEKLRPNTLYSMSGEVAYDPDWAVDKATLEANRDKAIRKILEKPRIEGGYGLTPPPKKN